MKQTSAFAFSGRIGWLLTSFALLAFGHNATLAVLRAPSSAPNEIFRSLAFAGILAALGTVAHLTTRRDSTVWKAVQVGMLFVTGLAANFLNPGTNNTGGLLIGTAIILVLQYSLLLRQNLAIIGVIAIGALLAGLVADFARSDDVGDSIGSVVFSVFFMGFAWVSFTEEITEHRRAREALAAESNRNQGFVFMGKRVAGLVHNIGTSVVTLAAINRQLSAMVEEDGAKLLTDQREIVSNLGGSVGQLMSLVRNDDRARTELVDVNRLVHQLVDHYAIRGIDVQLDLDHALPRTSARLVQLMQTIENLLQNSVEAFSGADTSDEQKVVRVATRRVRDAIRVVVSDNGCGIEGLEKAANEECYEHFQFGKTTKAGGNSVGMQYVLSTAQEAGWDITIESAVPGGTKVVLTVPAAVALVEAPAADSSGGATGASDEPIREAGTGSR